MLLLAASVPYSHGLGKGLFMIFWAWVVHGILFNLFSQISHVNEFTMPEAPHKHDPESPTSIPFSLGPSS